MSNVPPGLPNGPPDPIEPSTREYDRAIEAVIEAIAEDPERASAFLSIPQVRDLAALLSWEEITDKAHELAAAPPDVDEDAPFDTERHHNRLRNGG